nr:AT-hook motif nuclear-localized protein 10 [Ipomoea batatas]
MDYSDGSSPGASGFSIEPAKKKRGRPRKYSPDGNIALGLSPTPVTPISSMVAHPDSAAGAGAGSSAAATPSSENQVKKARGRPPGSVKKQMDALGSAGVGFTPHVITVEPGEDIALKIMEFSQQGPRTVCILSAIGAICNVTLRQPSTGGGTVTLEGQFEIISLSGSFLFSESDGHRSRPSGLSVSLAGADGKVVGGGVAGTLKAASQVQLIVGSFIADGKKPKYKPSSTPPPQSNMLNFSAQAAEAASPSEDASSDSSDENGGTPLNRGPPTYALPISILKRRFSSHRLGYQPLSEDVFGESDNPVMVVVGKERREFLLDPFVLEENPFRVLIDMLRKEDRRKVDFVEGSKHNKVIFMDVDAILFEHMLWLMQNDCSSLFQLNLRDIIDFYAQDV